MDRESTREAGRSPWTPVPYGKVFAMPRRGDQAPTHRLGDVLGRPDLAQFDVARVLAQRLTQVNRVGLRVHTRWQTPPPSPSSGPLWAVRFKGALRWLLPGPTLVPSCGPPTRGQLSGTGAAADMEVRPLCYGSAFQRGARSQGPPLRFQMPLEMPLGVGGW